MSVTCHLFKLIDEDVSFGKYAYMTPTERKKFDLKMDMVGSSDSLLDEYFGDNITNESKYIHPTTIDLSNTRGREFRRYRKYVSEMKKRFKNNIHYSPHPDMRTPYIVVDEICYLQGWFFNKKFFSLNYTVVYAFTKEGMINKINFYVKSDSRHLFDDFVKKFDKDMIFCIQF